MSQQPLVSIIINNFNYGRFLRDAIDSALHQTYSQTEVIVVDDGSADDSREIIASFGNRVIPVLKENGGQASAFNAGFGHSRGEVIIFLDSDDKLLPDIVGSVAEAFYAKPDVAQVQYRLSVMDALGNPTGELIPSAHLRMRSGDLRGLTVFPDDLPCAPTSGNAFSATVLRQIFPVPEQAYRISADVYLQNIAPLFGLVLSLDRVGGNYRVHGSNNYTSVQYLNLDQVRHNIRMFLHTSHYMKMFSGRDLSSVRFLAHRIISTRLQPALHTIEGDTPAKLWLLGSLAALRRPDLSLPMKSIYLLWFLSMASAPRPLVPWLAQRFFYPERRGSFNRLLAVLHGTPRLAMN